MYTNAAAAAAAAVNAAVNAASSSKRRVATENRFFLVLSPENVAPLSLFLEKHPSNAALEDTTVRAIGILRLLFHARRRPQDDDEHECHPKLAAKGRLWRDIKPIPKFRKDRAVLQIGSSSLCLDIDIRLIEKSIIPKFYKQELFDEEIGSGLCFGVPVDLLCWPSLEAGETKGEEGGHHSILLIATAVRALEHCDNISALAESVNKGMGRSMNLNLNQEQKT